VSSGRKRIRNAAILATAGLLVFQAIRSLDTLNTPVHAQAQNPVPTSATPTATTQAEQHPTIPENPGAKSYASQCAICHGDQREGILPAFPPLLGIKHQMNDQQIADLVRKGKGRMPGFPKLPNDEMTALLAYLSTAETSPGATPGAGAAGVHSSSLAEAGGGLFQQNCAFCHGRDAMGGETGPDLTQSKLVLTDKNGDQISEVVRNGRPEKKMPAFNFSSQELLSVVAFIRAREAAAATMKGGRRGVEVADLQTGNVDAGKQYFNGAGGCSKCHSPTGDLAGIATRHQGLRLEMRMLYPEDAKSKLTVTTRDGKTIEGALAYRDEWVIGMRDASDTYRSWRIQDIKFKVDSPVEAHVEQFPKYSDADIHNLMAYLQTLR
jgi:mono/diheme cytochrome c family protein